MEKQGNKDIFGRFVVAAIAAYFLIKYNYEVAQFIYSCVDSVHSIRASITFYLERAFDDANILVAFLLLIVMLLWVIIQLIVLLVGALIVWIAIKLNELYILPFLVTLIIVYSKFSYAFFVRPIMWLPRKVFLLLAWLARQIGKLFNLFVLLPIAEIISLKDSPKRKLHKALLSLVFVVSLCSVVIGSVGIVSRVVAQEKLVSRGESFVDELLSGLFSRTPFQNIQHQTVVLANTPQWTATGIALRKGDVVSITATGVIKCISPFRTGFYTGSPDGVEDAISPTGHVNPSQLTKSYRRAGFSPSLYVLPDEPINCLIGKVGIGDAFGIGSNETYTVRQDGELFLGINQLWKSGAWRNNSGQITVNLIIKREV